jgi:hypothetical protein
LTNLETEDRHPRALARAIAGAVRTRYQPPEMLSPQPDPDEEVTRAVRRVLSDIGLRRPSSLMSDVYSSWYRGSPGAQAVMAKQLAGVSGLTYLTHDDLAGRSLWAGEPLSRLVHYAAQAGGRSYILSVGVTDDRRVATLDAQLR